MCTKSQLLWGKERSRRSKCFFLFWEFLRYIPFALTLIVLAYVWSAFTLELCFEFVQTSGDPYRIRQILYLATFQPVIFLYFISFWRCVVRPPEPIPSRFRVGQSFARQLSRYNVEEERDLTLKREKLQRFVVDRRLIVNARDDTSGSVRYCPHCRLVKPDRAHHCSICGFCVMRMDHHCPWLNVCIHFGNYKFFFLALVYGTLLCAISILCVFIEAVVYLVQHGFVVAGVKTRFYWILGILIFLGVSLGIVPFGTLLKQHIEMVVINETTLEQRFVPIFNVDDDDSVEYGSFDLQSTKKNVSSVFGDQRWQWPLPIEPVFDRPKLQDGSQHEVIIAEGSVDLNSVQTSSIADENEAAAVNECGDAAPCPPLHAIDSSSSTATDQE